MDNNLKRTIEVSTCLLKRSIADELCTIFYLPAKKLEEMENDAPEIASALHKFIAGILSERLIDTNDAL